MSAGRCVRSITCAMVKVLPEPVTPSSTWVRSSSFTPFTSSLIAVGWSPAGSNGDTSLNFLPPSDFAGRSGRCGAQVVLLISGRPVSIRAASAFALACTPSEGL
jgi:hypothetical protein